MPTKYNKINCPVSPSYNQMDPNKHNISDDNDYTDSTYKENVHVFVTDITM